MKYCENCGRQLEDNARFCDECGAEQTEHPEGAGSAHMDVPIRNTGKKDRDTGGKAGRKSSRKGAVVLLSIFAAVLIAAGAFFIWQRQGNAGSNKTEKSVKSEQKASRPVKNTEKNAAEDTSAADATTEKAHADPAAVEFSTARTGFFTNDTWAMEIKSIDTGSKTITYDGYEFAFSETEPAVTDQKATIIDGDTMQLPKSTEMIKWNDDDSFVIAEKETVMAFSGGDPNKAHEIDTGAGTYKRADKLKDTAEPSAADTEESGDYITTAIAGSYPYAAIWFLPYQGSADEGYVLQLEELDGGNFYFTIRKGVIGSGSIDTMPIFFNKHVAHVKDSGSSIFVYNGKEYDLQFIYREEDGEMWVTGLDSLIPYNTIDNFMQTGHGYTVVFSQWSS